MVERFTAVLPTYSERDTSREPTPQELVTAEFQARRSLRALENYAEALNAVATSSGPTEVAQAASEAVTSIGKAASTVASFAGKPIKDSFHPLISTGGSLVATLLGEALEAQRFSILRSIVRSADPTVTELSRRISFWYFLEERDAIFLVFDGLDKALNAATPGVGKDLLVVEVAQEEARSIDEAARWRVFWKIAVAHRAILTSLEEPADFDKLMVANRRIQELVKLTKKFTEAVEKSKS